MDEATWTLVQQERESLAAMVAPLTDEQWATRSLCTEWTVKEVFAHVLMPASDELRMRTLAWALVKARGRLWTAGADLVKEYAAQHSTEQLVASMRRRAASREKPVVIVADNILTDLVVHGQDIAVPLGIDRPVPPAAARITLARFWSMGWPFYARKRLAGVRLRCEDCGPGGWEAGDGPEASGTAAALAMLMTGRTATALPMVHGPGAEVLAARLAAPAGR